MIKLIWKVTLFTILVPIIEGARLGRLNKTWYNLYKVVAPKLKHVFSNLLH